MNFIARLQGVFFSPQLTLKAISKKPVWVDALIILLIVLALYAFIVTPYTSKDRAELLKNNIKLQERLGEERFQQRLEQMENPSKAMIIVSSILSPISALVGFLISSLIILAIGRLSSTEGKYIQIFSVYLHANFIDKILGNGLRLILVLSQKSVFQTTTSLALLFPRLEVSSLGFIILSQVDFFQLWMFGILGYGLSHIFKIEIKKALFISYGFWLLKSLFYIALAFFGMKLMG